ncbi:MAG: CAP domain-containing protein [Lewinellaceae bacterium]|nr:CAP domain-containing protein [Lewinellaceae bacterium]
MNVISIAVCMLFGVFVSNNPSEVDQKKMIDQVNVIRTHGCHCGRTYMAPVQPVKWNNTLYKSALEQAEEMETHHFFNHYSIDGLNIGQRLDQVGYNWEVAGENLGEGQETFEEVLKEWMASYSHCKMLMHPKVEEMAVARYGHYWVQHFGKQLRRK